MATNPNTGGIRPVTLPNQFPPMPAVARILSRFDRAQLEGFISVAIDLADALDGDADLEPEEDKGEEERGEQAGWSNGIDQCKLSAGAMAWHHDDAEDDDPAGGDIVDVPHDPEDDSGELISGGGSDGDVSA